MIKNWKTKPLFLLILMLAVIGTNLIFFTYDVRLGKIFEFLNIEQREAEPISLKPGLLVSTRHCKIPDFDPFDTSVIQFEDIRGELHCSEKISITYTEGSLLRLDWTKIEHFFGDNFKYCQYTPIRRQSRDDFHYIYGEVSLKFDEDIQVSPEDEFIKVDCYNHDDVKISTNYHALVAPKRKTEKRSDDRFKEHVKKHALKETYNVQMVGVDSVSRLHFSREMPKTRQFLHEELQAFELTGYNKVADNTFANIVPILTGMFVEEMGWNQSLSEKTFDEYPFLWKNFSSAGYRTFFSEDIQNFGMFTFLKRGFAEPPTDYYIRPLLIARDDDVDICSQSQCLADRLATNVLLDYATEISRLFKDKPHFGFTFLSTLKYESFRLTRTGDLAYVTFLKQFKEEGHLDNTVLVFFSDNGFRVGKMRTNFIGKYEERLPFLYFVFPPSFHRKYPELVNNLKTNARRLTTPFDIHETLKDILYFDGVTREANRSNRGISLFREVPEERTCDQAGILPHWCMCMEQKPLDISSKLATDIGKALVSQINAMLVNVSHVCANLTLGNVSEVIRMKANENLLRFNSILDDVTNSKVVNGTKTTAPIMYQITLSTLPGQALFEGTVVYNPLNKSYQLRGDVCRVNVNDDQSRCVTSHQLKNFCFCVSPHES